MLQTWNLELRLNSQNKDQVTTDRNSHLPSLAWSPTNPRMYTTDWESDPTLTQLKSTRVEVRHKSKLRTNPNPHIISLVVILVQLVSPSLALPAKVVLDSNH